MLRDSLEGNPYFEGESITLVYSPFYLVKYVMTSIDECLTHLSRYHDVYVYGMYVSRMVSRFVQNLHRHPDSWLNGDDDIPYHVYHHHHRVSHDVMHDMGQVVGDQIIANDDFSMMTEHA